MAELGRKGILLYRNQRSNRTPLWPLIAVLWHPRSSAAGAAEIQCQKYRSDPVSVFICRAGFLCETARRNFRFGNSTENGARQSRAPLRALARTRDSPERGRAREWREWAV